MKVFLDENFNIKSVTDDVGDVIVRGSNSFDKLYVYVPTSVISDYTTISPLYAVKRADGRELGKYATLTNHASDGDAVANYYGWYGFFNQRDICVAGPLEITISFSLVKNGIASEKNVCKVTVDIKDGVMVGDDVLVLNNSNWVSLKTSIEALATNLANKADRTNSQQTITADTINASEASILELTSNLIEVISAIITNLTVSGNITAGNIGATTINGTTIKQDSNAVLDVRDIIDSFINESATKALSAKKGKELKNLVDTKVARADVVNNLNDTSTNKPLSAKMGKYLKEEIDYINSLLQSDDTTLDELQEIVTYIKNNKSLIDGITTSKVSVSDIIDNLNSNDTNKPLSAKQGHILKGLIDTLQNSIANCYTKSETDELLDDKADKSTTYTKDDVDDKLVLKQNITIPTITIAGVNYTNLEQAINAINDYAQTIEQIIGSISGTDTTIATRLTQLETSLSNLNTAWNNFTTGTSADNIINTLTEIQQELALLDSSRTNIIELSSLTLTQAQYDSINEYTIISYNNDMYRYSHATQPTSTTYHYFYAVTTDYIANLIVNSGLTATNYKANWQKASNLITSWSSTPSNTKYPSEKLVKDSLDTLSGKSLYHLGAFDTVSGNTITRQTGYVDLSKLNWTRLSNYNYIYYTNDLKSSILAPANNDTVGDIVSNIYETIVLSLFKDTTTFAIAVGGSSGDVGVIYVNPGTNGKPKGLAQYKLATAYTEQVIEGESILPLDSNMAQMIRQDVVEGLNLLQEDIVKVSNSSIKLGYCELKANTTYYLNIFETYTGSQSSKVILVDSNGTENLLGESWWFQGAGSFISPSNLKGTLYLNATFTDTTPPSKAMLTKSSHPYPHSEYHASKHITDEEATLLKKETVKCSNLVNESALSNDIAIDGANGGAVSYSGYRASEYFIPITPNTYYSKTTNIQVYFYDSNYNYITNFQVPYTDVTFLSPSSATYLRIECNSLSGQIMLNKGSKAKPYQEWNGDIVHEKDIEPVLLWENASPSSDFATQNITLSQNLTNFKYIAIKYRMYKTTSIIVKKISTEVLNLEYLSGTEAWNGTLMVYTRRITLTNATSIDFGEAYNLNGVVDNSRCIPVAIYGTNIL